MQGAVQGSGLTVQDCSRACRPHWSAVRAILSRRISRPDARRYARRQVRDSELRAWGSDSSRVRVYGVADDIDRDWVHGVRVTL